MRRIIVFFILTIWGIWFLIYHTTDTTPWHQIKKIITRPRISPLRTTPAPSKQHYTPTSHLIETTYPTRYATSLFATGKLSDRLQVLPTPQDHISEYIVIKSIGMIVPVTTPSKVSTDFFTDDDTYDLFSQGAVIHPQNANQWIIIAGHTSDYKKHPGNYKTIFQALALVKSGDLVDIYTTTPTYTKRTYQIFKTSVVDNKETSLLQNIPSDQLILYGCYPFGSTAQRIIVSARLVE
jgi:LPXTG-site transpeptidase (sortase) family protein